MLRFNLDFQVEVNSESCSLRIKECAESLNGKIMTLIYMATNICVSSKELSFGSANESVSILSRFCHVTLVPCRLRAVVRYDCGGESAPLLLACH